MTEEAQKSGKGTPKGCLTIFLAFAIWAVWMNQTAHHHPWSDDDVMELFQENRTTFETARIGVARMKTDFVIVDYLDYERRLKNMPKGSAEAIRQLAIRGIDHFSKVHGCISFGLDQNLENWRMRQQKSLLNCETVPAYDPGSAVYNDIHMLTAEQDTDEFYREPDCMEDSTWAVRPIEGNWYILHWLGNGRNDLPCHDKVKTDPADWRK